VISRRRRSAWLSLVSEVVLMFVAPSSNHRAVAAEKTALDCAADMARPRAASSFRPVEQ